MLVDFNTSYVVIKLQDLKVYTPWQHHFNTSYVVIKPFAIQLSHLLWLHFNTSNVTIKHINEIRRNDL